MLHVFFEVSTEIQGPHSDVTLASQYFKFLTNWLYILTPIQAFFTHVHFIVLGIAQLNLISSGTKLTQYWAFHLVTTIYSTHYWPIIS